MTSTQVKSGSEERAWLRWTLVVCALIGWGAVVRAYPVYFQRDDFRSVYWSQRHSFAQCFIPTMGSARWIDEMYRPLREFAFLAQYRLFGMDARGWHCVLGAVFIFTWVFWFKVFARLKGYGLAYLVLLVWFGAFQYLLTSLFWFNGIPHLLEIMLACAGFYFFTSGFGASRARVGSGIGLMIASCFAKEPAVLILPTAVAVYIVTNSAALKGWSRARVLAYAGASLLFVPLYFIVFPYALSRRSAPTGPEVTLLDAVMSRSAFYGMWLTSGLSGLLLFVPAIYYVVTRILSRKGRTSYSFPVAAVLAAFISLVILKGHLIPIQILTFVLGGTLFVAGLLLPRRFYFLLPWVFIPFGAMFLFEQAYRFYLAEIAMGMCAMVAIMLGLFFQDMAGWWSARITRPAITYVAIALAITVALGAGAAKAKKKVNVVMDRSRFSMSAKYLAPYIKQLPRRSLLLVLDYKDIGLSSARALQELPDEQKVRVQKMLQVLDVISYLGCLGRDDVEVAYWRDYRTKPAEFRRYDRVFVWLMTENERRVFAGQDIPSSKVASVGRDFAEMDLLELRARGKSRGYAAGTALTTCPP